MTDRLAGFGFEEGSDDWAQSLRDALAVEPIGRIGAIELLEEVGRGGQGVVYRGHDAAVDRLVAVKLIRSGPLAPGDFAARVQRELEATSLLDHPAVVTLFGAEWKDGQPALIMRWIDGRDLVSWAAEQTDRRRIIDAMITVCDAVQHAHQRGVIHRDLKPSNILVDPTGAPFVLDFGLAKIVDIESLQVRPALTRDDRFFGTEAYAAPEQLECGARAADVRSDVFSLGVILGEALTTGRGVGSGAPRVHAFAAMVNDRDLTAIIRQASAAAPDDRYPTADALKRDLAAWRAGDSVSARPPSRREQFVRVLRRHPRTSIAASLAAAALIALTVGLGVLYQRARAEAERARAAQVLFDDAMASIASGLPATRLTVEQILRAAEARLANDDNLPVETRAQLLNTLGERYALFGDWDQADRLARGAARLIRDAGYSRHAELARAWQLRGGVAAVIGDPAAVGLQQRAIDMLRWAHGDVTPEVATGLAELAYAYSVTGDDGGDPIDLYRESLAMFEACDVARSADAAMARGGLGWELIRAEAPEEALTLFSTARTDLEQAWGVGSLQWLYATIGAAESMHQLGRPGDSDAWLREAAAIAAAGDQVSAASTLTWMRGELVLRGSEGRAPSPSPETSRIARTHFDHALAVRLRALDASDSGAERWDVLWRAGPDAVFDPAIAADRYAQVMVRMGDAEGALRLLDRLEAVVGLRDDKVRVDEIRMNAAVTRVSALHLAGADQESLIQWIEARIGDASPQLQDRWRSSITP